MTPSKRALDVFLAILVAVLIWPVFLGLVCLIWISDGRPLFYLSERMRSPDQGFRLYKFRTMREGADDQKATGGHKMNLVTPTGRFLRRYRLDELPQLWNILRGDISFVGPRPPLRRYVEAFPDLYARVLESRPGVTGLATLLYHAEEERILATARDSADSERLYRGRCVPRKAALDLVYARNRNLCLDLRLMVATVIRALPAVSRNKNREAPRP